MYVNYGFFYISLLIGGGYNSNGTRTATTINGHMDQVLIYSGFGMSSPQLSSLYNSGNGNTTIGTLGGLILHEEYEDGTNTANAATHLILHSNNATHHTHGSRSFYSDTANCRFTTISLILHPQEQRKLVLKFLGLIYYLARQ